MYRHRVQDKMKTLGNMWTVFNKSKTNLIARGYMGNEKHGHVFVENLPIFFTANVKNCRIKKNAIMPCMR
jgi:hypothetical protein